MRLFDFASVALLAVFGVGLIALLVGVTVYLRRNRAK